MSEPDIVPIFKPVGLSPLQAGRRYAQQHGIAADRIGYAGRLDPMAEGVLLLLFGEANARQTELLGWDKEYRCTAVFGVSTDSYDVLGIPSFAKCTQSIDYSSIGQSLLEFKNGYAQAYPPYSAVRVDGKPLFWWARQDRLDEVTIPVRERKIYSISLAEVGHISAEALWEIAKSRLYLVEGDFRQHEIIAHWDSHLSNSNEIFETATFACSCSSGTFVRGLVHDLGKRLGCPATTLNLTRTAVGPYTITDCEYLG